MSKVVYQLPTDPEPNYEREIKLDGETYVFRFLYSDREDCVFLTISDITGDTLVSGMKLVGGTNILRPYQYNPKVPQGKLYLWTNGTDDSTPSYDEIGEGSRQELMYYADSVIL